MLKSFYDKNLVEAGCDEAGRGSLAGPVFAAAVIFPKGYENPLLNDSKQLSEAMRSQLRPIIQRDALSWAVSSVDQQEIDKINILWASVKAMQLSLDKLSLSPELILVDGNKFKSYRDIPFKCIIHGDAIYASIAAASILAKTYRDDFMHEAALQYPQYGWSRNVGYPTSEHRRAIADFGITPLHRRSFRLLPDEELFSEEMMGKEK